MKKPLILIIMDGFGFGGHKGNAIEAAKTPNLDRLFANYPLTRIGASGMDVGLPDGQMGNSEVGHTNIGAGRVVIQYTVMFLPVRNFEFHQPSTAEKGKGNQMAVLQILKAGNRLMLKTGAKPFCQFTDPAQPFAGIDDVADPIYPLV